MPKVNGPLFSRKARGQFGKAIIFTRAGDVRIYFKPRNPNSEAQRAQREAFKEFSVPGLTQEQADLLYAAILHDHDDRYSLLGHLHDDRYTTIPPFVLLGSTGLVSPDVAVTVPALTTYYSIPFLNGLWHLPPQVPVSFSAVAGDMTLRLNGAQPASGSLEVDFIKNSSPTGVKITVPAGDGSQSYVDDENKVSLSPGDLIRWNIKNNASAASPTPTVLFIKLYLV